MVKKDEFSDAINGSFGEDKDNYYHEIVQSKKNKGFVLILTTYGSKEFNQELLDTLKRFDFDEDNGNTISVSDIHGCDVLGPDYEVPDEFVSDEVSSII